MNYTDGVPVKISERFKPPPEIQLPSKLLNAIAKNQVPVAFDDDYNFDLERKILSKTTEWINWRQKQKTERQQRIYARELELQKRFEVEQKEKLNQVSYPSADEFSSSADEEEGDDVTNNEAKHSTNIPAETNPFNPNFNSILMPTQATASACVTNSRKSHRRYASNSSNKIDFSFFESEASPFDHLEMKSMNEMELLAQVLKSTTVESDESALERNNSSESENSETLRNNNNNNINENDPSMSVETAATAEPQEQPQQTYQHHNQFNPHQAYSNYYNNYANYTTTPTQQMQQQQQQFSSSLYPYTQPGSNNIYYTQNYAVNHMNYNHQVGANNNLTSEVSDNQASKSKSVPDIVKELNEELDNSQRRRIRNYSQNSHKEEISESTSVIQPKPDAELRKLPQKSQELAKQITQMGFKEDMVIRVLMRIGDNDKKIIDHLIVLNEFLTMGFKEEKISEALIKFDNNKDQALDFLIS